MTICNFSRSIPQLGTPGGKKKGKKVSLQNAGNKKPLSELNCQLLMIFQSTPSDQEMGTISSSSELLILIRLDGESNGTDDDEGVGQSDGPKGEDGAVDESNGPEGEEGVDVKGDDVVEIDGGDCDSEENIDESDGGDLDEGGDSEERSEPSLCFLLLIPLSLPLDLSSLIM